MSDSYNPRDANYAPGRLGDDAQQLRGTPPGPSSQASAEERARVAVGRNTNISGRLVFREPVRIEGKFRGEVSSSAMVVVGPQASVHGSVRSPRFVVMGEMEGEILDSRQVVLAPNSRVQARIEATSLMIQEGARFDGHVKTAPDLYRAD